MDQIDVLITDSGAPGELVDGLREQGVEVQLVN
jgi:DeoR/GlpR family transcriptional regulator of sugar metabolism